MSEHRKFTVGERVVVLNSILREQAEIIDVFGDNYRVRWDDGASAGSWYNWRNLRSVENTKR